MKDKFNIELTIMDPKTQDKRKLYLRAEFAKVDGTYGNGIYLAIKGRGETNFERLFDLRYEEIDTSNLEIVVAKWIYNNWSGSNGSFDVYKLAIEKVL